jgi:ornithine cyclodeaminase
MVGTGSLAPHLIESHVLVRPIREVRIWGRRTDRARALAASLARKDISIEAAGDLEEAVRWADIVSCATLAREPLVQGAWLNPGQHLDLVGAFTPEMREADDAAIVRGELYVDTRSGAFSESGELIGALARGIIDRSAVRGELSQLASGTFRRSSAHAITIFKSVGTALEDLAAAQLALRQSESPRR